MAKNNLEGINFQQYVDGVKEKKHSWKFFVSVMQDLTYHKVCSEKKCTSEKIF